MRITSWAVALSVVSYHAVDAALIKRAANPTVTFASGTVIGTATSVYSSPTATVNAFFGIPFAQSPPLRFAPPKPASAFSNPFVAHQLPPACVQEFIVGGPGSPLQPNLETYFNNPTLPPPPESEDCLYLNIYAPKDASPKNQKTVLFWVFGGNLQFGAASLAFYNGSRLAYENDVVVVTTNYRTNIFGFSNSPQIPFGQQNVGFLDQRMALNWVHNNIASFGGDPAKVTIFGESAGGYAVKQLLADPPSPPQFRAAIMESEAVFAPGNGLLSYETTLAHFGCVLSLSPIDCLRRVPATAIKTFIENNSLFFPPVDFDGTQVSDARANILDGTFARVPILMGTNTDEGRVFSAAFGFDVVSTTMSSSAAARQALSVLLGSGNNVLINNVINTALTTYADDIISVPYLLVAQIITDLEFTCPCSTLSSFLAQNGFSVWRYLFSAVFPSQNLFYDPGAYHTAEIPEVFGTYRSDAYGNVTQAQIQLSKYMRKAWTDFAKNPTAGPGWPALGTNGGLELQRLGADGGAQVVLQAQAPYDAASLCPVLNPVDMALQISY